MKSPWKSLAPLDPNQEYLVLASSIPPLSRSSTLRLFKGERAVRRQLVGTDGLVGFATLARPARKQFATLSVWVDEDALTTFTDGSPHGELRAELKPAMGDTKFVRWTIKGSDGRPSWRDALQRLG
jgi:hypothetical protein